MASEYNERFSYSDPLHKHLSSRTTRYRLKKKRRLLVNTCGPSNERCSDRSRPEDAAQSAYSEVQAESLTEVDCTETVDNITFTPDNECEKSGSDNEAEDMPEVDTQSDNETEDVWRYYDSDSDNFDAAADKTTCESHDMSGTLSENHECISGHAASVLYEGSSLTVAASSIMMMNLKMKHNLTDLYGGCLETYQIPLSHPKQLCQVCVSFEEKLSRIKVSCYISLLL